MNKEKNNENEFAFGRDNYRWLIIGVVIIAVGNLLMVGGGAESPAEFNGDEIFSFRRITLAPIVILAGFATVLISIIKKSK